MSVIPLTVDPPKSDEDEFEPLTVQPGLAQHLVTQAQAVQEATAAASRFQANTEQTLTQLHTVLEQAASLVAVARPARTIVPSRCTIVETDEPTANEATPTAAPPTVVPIESTHEPLSERKYPEIGTFDAKNQTYDPEFDIDPSDFSADDASIPSTSWTMTQPSVRKTTPLVAQNGSVPVSSALVLQPSATGSLQCECAHLSLSYHLRTIDTTLGHRLVVHNTTLTVMQDSIFYIWLECGYPWRFDVAKAGQTTEQQLWGEDRLDGKGPGNIAVSRFGLYIHAKANDKWTLKPSVNNSSSSKYALLRIRNL